MYVYVNNRKISTGFVRMHEKTQREAFDILQKSVDERKRRHTFDISFQTCQRAFVDRYRTRNVHTFNRKLEKEKK